MQERDDRKRIRILLLDEHGLLRTSLARLLSLESDFEVAGESGAAGEALEMLQSSFVDVVLLDFGLGVDHANEFISAARASGYQGRFLIVTAAADAASSAMAFKLGASGIFLKSDGPERLVQAIRLIHSGEVWIDQKTIVLLAERCVGQPVRPAELKLGMLPGDREQKVLLGILGGLTNKKIGATMGISETAVKNILQVLFGKTGVRTRSQLVRLAMEGSLGNLGQSGKSPRRKNSGKTPAPPATDATAHPDHQELRVRRESLA